MGIKSKLINVYEKMYEKKMHFDDARLKKRIGVPDLMTIEETIDYINEHKCSISRFGDGELKLACGAGIKFQNEDAELAQRLKEILKSNDERCLVCLTDTFDDISWMVPSAYKYTWRILWQYRQQWTNLLDLSKKYGNAYITRFYIDRKDKSQSGKLFTKLKTLWDNEDIVIIEGEKSRLGYHNDLFSNTKSIERILCPAKNAFSKYDDILEVAKKVDKNKLLILAVGPLATVLAYDLAKLGYRALDIGHADIEYEWYLMGATEKVKIEGKYTSEANNGDSVSDEADDLFNSQVIAHINGGNEG